MHTQLPELIHVLETAQSYPVERSRNARGTYLLQFILMQRIAAMPAEGSSLVTGCREPTVSVSKWSDVFVFIGHILQVLIPRNCC